MTEMQIKTLKNKTLKEKIRDSKIKQGLLNEISNYESAINADKRFIKYYEDRIAKLKQEMEELCL